MNAHFTMLVMIAFACDWVVAQTLDTKFTTDIGGRAIELPAEWKTTQVRAQHPGDGVEMSAKTFTSELSVAQCTAAVAVGLTTNSREQLEKLSKRIDMPRTELAKTLASSAGRKLLKEIKEERSSSPRLELVDVFSQKITGGMQFDIRTRAIQKNGQALYRRDFVLGGTTAGEIVQITYSGPSEQVFTNRAIIRSVRPQRTGPSK